MAGNEFYDYAAKYTPGLSETSTAAEVPAATRAAILKIARDAYRAIGAEGFARIDFLLRGDDVYLSEINTIPGFTPISLFPTMPAAGGYSFADVCEKVVELAIERHAARVARNPLAVGPAAMSRIGRRAVTVRPARRVGGPGRRTRLIRRRSAGLTPVRAGAALAMLLSAAAIYGLAATSAFGFERLEVKGAAITDDAEVREPARPRRGHEPVRDRHGAARGPRCGRSRPSPAPRSRSGCPNVVSVEHPRAPADRRLAGRRAALVRRRDRAPLRRGAGRRRPRSSADLPLDQRRPRGVADRSASARRSIRSISTSPPGSPRSRRPRSAAARRGLAVGVSDENGFVLSSVPRSWAAVFGFYGLSLRTPDLVPAQVVLLEQLLRQAGEANVALVILADADDGTYIPKASPAPSASPSPP